MEHKTYEVLDLAHTKNLKIGYTQIRPRSGHVELRVLERVLANSRHFCCLLRREEEAGNSRSVYIGEIEGGTFNIVVGKLTLDSAAVDIWFASHPGINIIKRDIERELKESGQPSYKLISLSRKEQVSLPYRHYATNKFGSYY